MSVAARSEGGRSDGVRCVDVTVSLAGIAYIGIPSLVFFAAWFTSFLSVPLIGGLVLVVFRHFRRNPVVLQFPWKRFVWFFAASAAFDLLSGINGFVYLNADLIVRSQVLNDLILQSWPVIYDTPKGEFLLRAPLAYYMPAALIGKLTGFTFATHVMWLWCSLGLALVLSLLFHDARRRTLLWAVPLFYVFSGMDILGVLVSFLDVTPTSCIEWWSQYFQMPSHTTSIFWAPNHAIPCWILSAIFIRKNTSPALDPLIPVAVALMLLWTPVAAPGVIFLFAITYWKSIPRYLRDPNYWVPALTVFLLALPFIFYIVYAVGSVDTVLAQPIKDIYGRSVARILFILFEFAILAFFIFRYTDEKFRLILVGAFVTLLTLFDFGPGNDFLLRSSNPPTLLLFWSVVGALPRMVEVGALNRAKMTALIVVVGMVTSLFEIDRALLFPINWKIPTENLYVMSGGKAHHYTAKIEGDSFIAYLIGR